MKPEITIIGFPKCGTSALIRCFLDDPEIRTLRTPEGAIEVAWPLIRDIRPEPETDRILVHKYSSYAFSRNSLRYLVEVNSNNLLVLCVRDPARSLVSWHNMHRSIARSGKQPQHFAWKERDFYADCTLSDYYGRFASSKLQYDRHLASILKVVPKERLVVVSQERMAQDIHSVTAYLKALARGEKDTTPPPPQAAQARHVGYADKAGIVPDEATVEELRGVRQNLAEIISNDVIHKCVQI